MARVKKNVVTEGLSGKLGNNIVFRQRAGKTIVATPPIKTRREPTEAQKNHRRKFRKASRYAMQATQDPTLRAAYEQQAKADQSPYNVALADYLNRPAITELDLKGYTGAVGSPIVIEAEDDYLITGVQVAIYHQAGTLLEEGPAQLHDNGIDWVYTAQQANGQPNGSRLVVRARDLPGNVTEREEVLG